MAEYIDKQALIGFLEDIQQPKRPITEGFKFITIDEAIRVISERPTADVIERAKVLARIKEARETMEGYSNTYKSTNNNHLAMVIGYCISLIDKLIVEVE